jgi:ATP-binding cassette subfamily F protein uup
MISYLQVENLTKTFGDLTLFESLSFGIAKDQKTALIAKNGVGKTTLLNMLAGKDTPDSGEIIYRNEIRTGYLSQEPVMDPESTIRDYIFHSSGEIMDAVSNYEEALFSNDEKQLSESIEQMDRLGAWDYEVKVKQILTQLNVGDFHRTIKSLSGGEKKRLALAEVLIHEPDFLILDEPTNHLDLNMIEWLEDYLRNNPFTLLMVTHDRYFLDRVCNDILELDEQNLYRYKGNYSWFLKKRAERIHNQEREVEKAKNQLRKEEDWIRRMPKARGTKAKHRVDNYYHLKDVASQKREDATMKVDFDSSRLGKKIMLVKHLTRRYDQQTLIQDFSYQFSRYEKIGIVGPNGSGKTTFLNLVAGLDTPDHGSIEAGETLKIGYYRQEGMQFKEDERVIDVARNVAEAVTMSDGRTLTAKQFLDYFLFDYDKQYVRVAKLSGGEKRRLYLLTVLLKKPNFLILDEPTNDLDIMTLNVLEDYLSHFKGCVVIVSHDRYFMDSIVDHIFAFHGDGNIKDYPGTYTQYRQQIMESFRVKEAAARNGKDQPHGGKSPSGGSADKREKQSGKRRAASYKEKMEYKKLEEEIDQLEQEKADIEKKMNQGEMDSDEMVEKSTRLGEIMEAIDQKTDRYLELSELIESKSS